MILIVIFCIVCWFLSIYNKYIERTYNYQIFAGLDKLGGDGTAFLGTLMLMFFGAIWMKTSRLNGLILLIIGIGLYIYLCKEVYKKVPNAKDAIISIILLSTVGSFVGICIALAAGGLVNMVTRKR